ncbi:hypothetical protein ND991_16350, partial [Gordonia sputi]|uniref:hypothetical protein n=1 Tax=Gordonia sputi TaxID=36823 RepID=UPI0020438ED5
QPYSQQNFQHNLSQRDKNLTKQKLATPRPKDLSVTNINHHIIQKLGHTMPKYGIKQFITHYRVLKERTPTGATPEKGLDQQACSVWRMLTPSPEQLFQPTRRSR